MRKFVLIFALVAMLVVSGLAVALDVKGSYTCQAKASGARAVFTQAAASAGAAPQGFIVWTGDESTFYVKRANAGSDSGPTFSTEPAMKIPGYTMLPILENYTGAAGLWYASIEVTAHTDSVYCIWVY